MVDLILDTSTELCILSLAQENLPIAQEIFSHSNLLSSSLLPTIRSFVEAHCGSPKNLRGVSIGIGPGSYTGTRIGVAVAKSLSFGLDIPLKTFSSPLAFLPSGQGTFAFVIPTRSGQFFALSGMITHNGVLQNATGLLNSQEIEGFKNVEFLICSNPNALPPSLREKTTPLPPVPNTHLLCHFLSEQQPVSLETIELLYLNTLL